MRLRALARRIDQLSQGSVLVRLQALLVVLVLHLGVFSVAFDTGGRAVLTGPVALAARFPDIRLPEGSAGMVASRVPARPAPRASETAASRAGGPRPPATPRWIPSGTGMWTHLWSRTEHGHTLSVVRRAQEAGLSHLYVRTGTRKGGFDAQRTLNQLLKATRGTGIKVIAWDFPILNDPIADARRLAAAANYVAPGTTERVAAVAPDIETAAEGTKINTPRMDAYFRELRRLLPAHIPILATVPWPSEHRVGKYPYWVAGKWADAIVPMAYWINRDPSTVTRQSIERLAGYGKPILPAGQAYDPRIDVPSLNIGPPNAAQMRAFFLTARHYGAPSVSLWVWNTANATQWHELSKARVLFPLRDLTGAVIGDATRTVRLPVPNEVVRAES